MKKNNNKFNNLLFSGKIKIFNSGYAIVNIDNSDKEIFISKNHTGHALTDDQVLIQLSYKNRNINRTEGKVIKIIKRSNKQIIGIVKKILNSKFYIVRSISLHVDIYINNLKGAKEGNKVLVKIVDWPMANTNPKGEIIQVLGMAGLPSVEMHAILIEYNITSHFSQAILSEANNLSFKISDHEIQTRRDIRNILTFTIDPVDAKDFDDAISLRYLENNNIEIGVHIADVSYYVKENSLLDHEAYKRSTSIYLVNNVIPMLPEIISNDLCSLRPHQNRLTFSVIFEMNKQAKILNTWFGKTIICSNKRFTYEEVQKIIDNKKGLFSKEILLLNRISKILKKERIKNGSINFDNTELKFQFNNEGFPINLYIKPQNESYALIEEFMLLVNKQVSEFVSLKNYNKNIHSTYIYRIHDKPNLEKLNQLKNIIQKLGYKLNIKKFNDISHSLNKLLKSVKDKSEKSVIHSLIMRTMKKASYSYTNIGHYGLGFSYYSHFTSPIRRYPDIIAHRLLENCLLNKKILYNFDTTHSYHFSQRERVAIEIEREYIRFTQINYIKPFIGKVFEGIISSITDWNIYIEIISMKIDGMIRIRDMTDDIYVFNQKNCFLTGKKYGKLYYIGQKVNIKIININTEKKYIDLQFIN